MTRLTSIQITQIRHLAECAAQCAMSFYQGDVKVTIKKDESPVTQADLAVSELLEKHLPDIVDVPVLSEENLPNESLWKAWETYWLIDPIDGTKHFINQTGEFCICIALIYQHQVVFGLIVAPTTGQLWLAQTSDLTTPLIIEKYTQGELQPFPAPPPEKITATLSSFAITERMQTLLSPLPHYDWYCRGSALKYIDLAEGKATLYPKMWDTCEWDSAAGQCIVECAGGAVIDFRTGENLSYGHSSSVINSHFLAYRGFDVELVQALLVSYSKLNS